MLLRDWNTNCCLSDSSIGLQSYIRIYVASSVKPFGMPLIISHIALSSRIPVSIDQSASIQFLSLINMAETIPLIFKNKLT